MASSRRPPRAPRGRSPRALGALKRTQTGRAPMLMVGAWVRAPSIGRSKPPGAVCLAVRSAAAYAACLVSGSAAKSLVHACIGRLSEPAGTGRARWLRRLAGICCAEMLPITAAEAGRALGPMLPSSARELWPFSVLRGADLLSRRNCPPRGQFGGCSHHTRHSCSPGLIVPSILQWREGW